jgi:non-ribosomal peptide synthetase component F
MFALQNAPRQAPELAELTLSRFQLESGTSKFDLTLYMGEEAGGLKGLLEYNADLFDADTIARLAEHFRVLLEGVMADPEQRIFKLPLLTKAEWPAATDLTADAWRRGRTPNPGRRLSGPIPNAARPDKPGSIRSLAPHTSDASKFPRQGSTASCNREAAPPYRRTPLRLCCGRWVIPTRLNTAA